LTTQESMEIAEAVVHLVLELAAAIGDWAKSKWP
jgi:hypothetical protein